MAEFKVGEIAIFQNCERAYLNGCEVEIIGELRERSITLTTGHVETSLAYVVRLLVDGSMWGPAPHQLRRRPPKSNDTEWANAKVKNLLKVKPEEVTV